MLLTPLTRVSKRIVDSHIMDYKSGPESWRDGSRNSETYGATKAGIIQLSKYAVHLAQHQINVNTVSPGGIFNTENPQSDAFLRKYSDRCPWEEWQPRNHWPNFVSAFWGASYINGHNLVVDGGMSAWWEFEILMHDNLNRVGLKTADDFYVIAEIGINHGGDIKKAYSLIDCSANGLLCGKI